MHPSGALADADSAIVALISMITASIVLFTWCFFGTHGPLDNSEQATWASFKRRRSSEQPLQPSSWPDHQYGQLLRSRTLPGKCSGSSSNSPLSALYPSRRASDPATSATPAALAASSPIWESGAKRWRDRSLQSSPQPVSGTSRSSNNHHHHPQGFSLQSSSASVLKAAAGSRTTSRHGGSAASKDASRGKWMLMEAMLREHNFDVTRLQASQHLAATLHASAAQRPLGE